MKRVLFYCQHLLGVGHVTRGAALCRALARTFEVDLLLGGPDIGLDLRAPGLRRVDLPPLLMREEDSSLYDPVGALPPERVFAARRAALERALAGRSYDHVLVDLFPFGRRKFRREIFWIIERLKARDPRTRVLCSLRDVMVEREPERDAETVDVLRRCFDGVLVHSDPRFLTLERSFNRTEAIADRLVYTGFVARGEEERKSARRARRVLISLGGGSVGGRLAEAAVAAAGALPDREFRVAVGPHTPGAQLARLKALARPRPNVRVVGFLTDFHAALRASEVSVSLAGYNTVMDLLRTRTRGLVFPYGANQEQALRARRFEEAGLLTVLTEADLAGGRLPALLRRELSRPYPEVAVDLDGAEKTRAHLESLA